MAVAEQITSPELVLVSPPELAALAREALPDYEVEYELWVERIRAELAVTAPAPAPEEPSERRFTLAAIAFTAFSAAACIAPLVLLIAFR